MKTQLIEWFIHIIYKKKGIPLGEALIIIHTWIRFAFVILGLQDTHYNGICLSMMPFGVKSTIRLAIVWIN